MCTNTPVRLGRLRQEACPTKWVPASKRYIMRSYPPKNANKQTTSKNMAYLILEWKTKQKSSTCHMPTSHKLLHWALLRTLIIRPGNKQANDTSASDASCKQSTCVSARLIKVCELSLNRIKLFSKYPLMHVKIYTVRWIERKSLKTR